MEKGLLVSVVDDDESVRESLPGLLRALGFSVNAFSSGEKYLESDAVRITRCLIVDVSMPGMSGPELGLELKRKGIETPIIFITAHGDAAVRRQLLAGGAVECLIKPFSDADLLNALKAALPNS